MRNAKRKIGLLLILCMFVSMLPASVWADGGEPFLPFDAAADDVPEPAPEPSGSSGDFVEIAPHQLARSTAADVAAPFSLPAGAVPDGTFKNNKDAGYQFDRDTATLTITGSGAMDDYDNPDEAPWASYSKEIKNIVIETGITQTGTNAFVGCSALTSVVIESPTTEIDTEAFKACLKLTSAECTDVWKYTNGELSILTNDAIKNDPQWASLKDRVTKVTIESGVSGITKDTFKDMDKLTDDVDQRPPVVSYKGNADAWIALNGGCGEWGLQAGDNKYLLVSCTDGLIGKCGTDAYFKFKDGTLTISGTKISDLGTNTSGVIYENGEYRAPWYSVRSQITALVIPDTITEIGAFAFYSCSKLTSVKISDKITAIGDYAFAKCTALSSLEIAKDGGDLSIGKYAFWDCTALKNLGAAKTTTSPLKIGIPSRVKKIGEAAFRGSGLKYEKKEDAGHIYYQGDKDEWLALNNNWNSPDVLDGKLLTATREDVNTYAFVHYMGADGDALYYPLTFDGGLGSKVEGTPPQLAEGNIVSRIVDKALDTKTSGKDTIQTVAADTRFKLPAEGNIKRPGFHFTGWLCSADNRLYQTGDEFTMPKKEVTFTAQWAVNVPETGDTFSKFIEQFVDAKNAGRVDYPWRPSQAAASSESELNKWLYDTMEKRVPEVAAKTGIDQKKLGYRIQIRSFTPAVMGIENMTAGQNGHFTFDIHFTLKTDGGNTITATASVKDGVITSIKHNTGKTDITYTVTFDPGEGIDETKAEPKPYYAGTTLLLPKCKFIAPANKEFQGWKCKLDDVYKVMSDAEITLLEDLVYRENTKFTMRPANVTFTAQWKDIKPVSTITTVSSTANVVMRQGAPRLTVQNLDTLVSSDLAAGTKVSVTLEAAPVDQASPEVARLKTASLADEMTFVDLTINKTVGDKTSAITDTNGTLIAVTLPFDGKNAENVKVYRDHEGQVDALTDETRTGERIAVTGDSLTIYASKFSVYAIAFDRKTAAPGGSSGGSNGGGSSSGSSSSGGSSKPSIRDNGAAKPGKPQSSTGGGTASRQPFQDVPPGAWYYEAATWAYDAKIAKGEGGRRLNPNKLCTRAEMLTFLWRSLGNPEPAGTGKSFVDVPSGAYYTKAVQWAASRKIVKGEGGKRFNPDAAVTRAEAITFLYRALGVPSASVGRFTDVPASAYYAEAVEWAADQGIAKGMGKRSFSPASPCTRAQVLTFLYRSQS